MTVWTQKWSLSNCGLSRPHEIITEKIWKKRLVLKDRPAAIIVGKCMYEKTWNTSFVVTYLLVWKKVILTFFFLFLVWSIYRIFFLLATTNITKKKLEREHSHHQCSEYTAAGIKFGPASLSEYQYLCSSNGNKNDF